MLYLMTKKLSGGITYQELEGLADLMRKEVALARKENDSVSETVSVHFSACAFGGGDNLDQPIGMSKASTQKVCYVSFWDDVTLATQEAEGHKIGETLFR
ncbi:hypothetical protein DY000_02041487 [Brassica cretica]|uniref:TOD1/MUCI70 glycosyltransferase-like domain-containing protein n=1 Tax=Brassica cretica TaxID=69181 RepID=A0ABQ7BJB2_BRACR|nr:hypothetical protein DY000_02041487 [Brassica cretica]